MLSPGTPAPDFTLPAGGGQTARLSDYRGKQTVVVYFYPKDETPGCTVESCSFRDSHEAFLSAGAVVIGISADSVESHDRFAARHNLPFLLASDRGGATAKAYDVERSFLGLLAGRATFVIDREGIIRDAFASQVRVNTHVSRALELVRSLEKKA